MIIINCAEWPIFSQIIALLRPVLEFLTVQTGNFGIALILFTIGVKFFLIPLIIKQQKSMVAMQKIQPLTKELQEKYKNDKEKLNMETMKLYKEHKVNPLASCFPMLIQMPVLFSMWFLIQEIANDPYVYVDGVQQMINFNFLGFDLQAIPNFDLSSSTFGIELLWIIPILAGLTTYLSSRIMQQLNSAAQPTTPDGKNPMQTMTMIFPLITLGIAFTFPAGVGLYWIISNLLQTGQQWGVNKFLQNKNSNSGTEVIEVNANKNRKNRKKR